MAFSLGLLMVHLWIFQAFPLNLWTNPERSYENHMVMVLWKWGSLMEFHNA